MVRIVESTRAAWSGLKVPAEVRADFLRTVVAAGFLHVDAVSFAEPDAARVLEYFDPPDEVETIAVVRDAEAAARAVKNGTAGTLGFQYSLSPAHLERIEGRSAEDTLDALEAVGTVAYKAGLDVLAYVEMAFGNGLGDAWSADEVVAACDLLADAGVSKVVLVDTAALATPRLLAEVVADVLAVHDRLELALALCPGAAAAEAQVRAGYAAGCRGFHATLGGHGAVPFASRADAGWLATGELLRVLGELEAELPPLTPLERLEAAAAEIARRYGARVQ